MTRLQAELHRLYLPHTVAGQLAEPEASSLIDDQGRVRAAVLELARPADWPALAAVWRGVQADLNLPAPAIAVNGLDGYQLWFSLSEPVPADQATAFLDALRRRYLADIAPQRVGLKPAVGPLTPSQTQSGQWSAFVAADLAPVFADEPWLDTPPSPEGQADLLCRLASIKGADFRASLDGLGVSTTAPAVTRPTPTGAGLDPKQFLLDILNDDTVALGLRIEAAKALLPRSIDPR